MGDMISSEQWDRFESQGYLILASRLPLPRRCKLHQP